MYPGDSPYPFSVCLSWPHADTISQGWSRTPAGQNVLFQPSLSPARLGYPII